MTEFQDKETKKLYVKCKLVVKKWENEFTNDNGRLPTREDIKFSPSHVRESYKKYYKIKTQLLASQILTDDLTDSNTSDKIISPLETTNESNNTHNETKSSAEEVLNTSDIETQENPNKEVTSQTKEKNLRKQDIDLKTWGKNLNVKKPEHKKEKPTGIKIFSEKLFQGSTFNKRNPRKPPSFSKKRSESSQSLNVSINNTEDDSNMGISSTSENSEVYESCVDGLNETIAKGDTTMDLSALPPWLSSSTMSSSFLGSSVLVSGITEPDTSLISDNQSQATHKLSLIQEITSGAGKSIQNIHEGWVERCVDLNENPESKRNSDSGFDSMENSPPLQDTTEKCGVNESSDDDVIGDSDDEHDFEDKTNLFTGSQKRKAIVLNTKTEEEEEEATESKSMVKPFQNPVITHQKKRIRLDPKKTESHCKENAKKSILERKIQSGTLNENFVKINLEKKIYVRGKRNFNLSKYKKQQFKKEKKKLNGNTRESGGVVQCYKCGEQGHFSSKCKAQAEDKLLEVDDDDDDEDILPTLEEVQKMVEEKAKMKNFKNKNIFTAAKPPQEEICNLTKVKCLYQLDEDGSLMKTPPEVFEALEKFGHSQFRPGQEEAIMRILSGLSTLLMISTGGGKSLCYQLPAYLYAKKTYCITLVISPLVSLMEDQVSGTSSVFRAGCLHTSQTQKQREIVLEEAKKGKLHALLVSPEAVVSGDSSKGFGAVFKQLPPIAFACIDEVHCISQWSHNFRPSYLMINRVLKEKFGISTILGLTATATISSIKSITNELGISSEKDVIKDIPLPDNIFLSISRDQNKEEALIQLLKSSKFEKYSSILIYCTRRDDCEKLAVLIRTVLQNSTSPHEEKKRKKLSWTAESYHAGMAAARRKQVQKAFMTGNVRIVVATVAFGMGINKQDIRAVIHYNMPRDFESYVQETGRAGRDGMPAHCHLFLEPEGRDLNELRRHIYSNSIDRFILRKLLQRVFVDCDCKEKGKQCEGHEIAFNIQDTIQALDIPEENIYTLLCYLELHKKKFIKVLAPAYINCRIKSYKGVKPILLAATKCPPLAYVCALDAQSKKKKSSMIEFNVMEVARKIDWDSALVKSQLKNLEWETTEDLSWKKSGIIVEFHDLGFRILARGDMSPNEQDEALDFLTERVVNQEKRSLTLLNLTFSTLDHFACNRYVDAVEVIDENNSKELKSAIRHYFETEKMLEEIPLKELQAVDFDEDEVISDIRDLICTYRDNSFNARAVARIFHGIQSPNYPATIWYSCQYWRKHIDKDFNRIIDIAKLEVLRLKY